ncbi:cell division protein ZipA [Alteromonadaceae bacterium Bs31]|nr:cell division protein ZipA [Alteromonadaceae bacterium Bs31]
MRDWLTVIIVLLIIGILLDGFRRMRQARRENLKLSKNAQKADQEAVPVSNSEFPSGGARVIGYRDPKLATDLNENLKQGLLAKKTTLGAPNRIPEQVTLNLDEHVPMLMDSVAEAAAEEEIELVTEPSLGSLDDIDVVDDSTEPAAPAVEQQSVVAKSREVVKEEAQQEPDEVLIINVMAHRGMRFSGENLLAELMDQDMKLGAMDIFHRHVNDDGDGPVLFSLANMVVPGTFNLAKMKEFETPGISFFLSLPLEITDENGKYPDGLCIRAYDTMASTAKALAENLDGELKDENRSIMTQQTIEHGRQRVVEYERKQKLRAE